ncbi:probable peptidoglycan muropeptide transporter SLC46 [Halyomorpha halys]|uniref:probable peptidoglycan muropeptide transporter SLC46 n=1 Tax=Halyomorpha halys TaxID=286706 RepID=UPI0006D50FAE|nr:proton-coupled folate transporter-like isoform X1 [Halyomorpha halys]
MVESKDRTSLLSRIRGLYLSMTVEPMLAWYIIGSVVAILATQNLNLEKACRVNLRFGDEVCTALERRETANYTKEEQAVQQLVASMAIWKTLVQSAVPAFLILFLGSWSDRRGRRKPCMLLPITGEFMTAIGLILCTYFFYELPMEVAGITEAIFPAFTGGWMTMFMAVFSYMGDITSLETRTLRIGIVNVCSSLSVPIGTAVSGILYKKIGYYGVFSLSASIYVLSFFYGYYKIPEEKKVSISNEKVSLEEEVKPGIIGFFRDFFDLHHIKDTISVAFKSGANNRRKRVMLLMIVVIVVFGPMHGEMTVMYLFTRYRFNWNEVDYSIFNTYSMVTNLIGTAISVGVFSHMLKIDDAIIGVISCMSKILAGFVFAFATTTTMIYIAPLVDIVNGTSFIAMRSIASKLVPPDELGKVNSVFGLAEAIVPVIYGPMYSAVYRATMNTVPGAFFLLGGALTAPAIVIFLWMYSEHKKDAARLALENAENEKSKEMADTKIEPEKEMNGSAIVTKDLCISYSNEGFEPDMTNSKL